MNIRKFFSMGLSVYPVTKKMKNIFCSSAFIAKTIRIFKIDCVVVLQRRCSSALVYTFQRENSLEKKHQDKSKTETVNPCSVKDASGTRSWVVLVYGVVSVRSTTSLHFLSGTREAIVASAVASSKLYRCQFH